MLNILYTSAYIELVLIYAISECNQWVRPVVSAADILHIWWAIL